MNLSTSQMDSYAAAAGFSGTGLLTIVAIAQAESGGRTDATNSVGNSAGTDRGILQINSFYHSEVSDACAFDPACSFKQAFRISSSGTNFNPWVTFTSGAYKKFLAGTSLATVPTTSTTPNSGNVLTDWIASIAPLIAWLSQPVRLVKLAAGIVLVLIALYMLIQPEQAQSMIASAKKGVGYV